MSSSDLVRPATDFPTIVAGPTFAVVPPALDAGPRRSTPGTGFVGERRLRPQRGRPTRRPRSRPTRTTGRGSRPSRRSSWSPTSAAGARWRRSRPATSTYRRLAVRRHLARLRRDARAVSSVGRTALSLQYYGFDTSRAAVRRRPGPPGLRAGRRLAPADRPVGAPAPHARRPGWSRRASRAGATTRLPARPRPGRRAAAPRRRRLSRAAPASRRSRCSAAGRHGSGVRRRAQARARDHRPGRDPGRPGFFDRLADGSAARSVAMGWVADYPGPNDFLGVLLGSGASNNYGRWCSPAFDQAIARRRSRRRDPAAAAAATTGPRRSSATRRRRSR